MLSLQARSLPSDGISLVSIYERKDRAELLFSLLLERDETVSIHHKKPNFPNHVRFIDSKPYETWDFIVVKGQIVGACNLTKKGEIGIFIFRKYQGKGYGPAAVQMMIELHGKRKYIANINPKNTRSASMFAELGFKPVYHVYELDA